MLTGSLPGLRRRRAMTLNLTGSAVSNVAPLGGAWGVGLNALMLRRWGYAGKDIASFMMISNIWNVLAKLAVSAGRHRPARGRRGVRCRCPRTARGPS